MQYVGGGIYIRKSSVDIVITLRSGRPSDGGSIPGKSKNISPLPDILSCCVANPAFSMRIGGSYPEDKAADAKSWPLTSIESLG